VIGVSPDSEASHERFAGKYDLSFTLLSDPNKVLAQTLGVWQLKKNYGREYLGVVRSTFLVDAKGKVARAWRGVKVKGHVDAVLTALGDLSA
jgi:peroxiredoxin Q/BCP